MRIAVVTTAPPPTSSGQSLVLGRLFCASDMDVRYFSDSAEVPRLAAEAGQEKYFQTSKPSFSLLPGITGHEGLGGRLNNFLGLMKSVYQRSRELVGAFKPWKPDLIVGCSGDPFDLPASYLASQKLSLPFVAYLFDDPAVQFPPGVYRRMARFWEPLWTAAAAAIIVPNEVLAADLESRRPQTRPVVVRNPVEDVLLADDFQNSLRPVGNPIRIAYTGSVYHAQGDAFCNLIAAMSRTPGKYLLEIYTSQPQSALDTNGIVGDDVVRHDHVGAEGAFAVQRQADILFLPLAFRSSIQEVIRSSAPAKTGEYLASGTPVPVHAPQGSFLSTFFAQTGAGVVVDKDDVSSLAVALDRIGIDTALRLSVVRAARLAVDTFSQKKNRQRLEQVLRAAAGHRQ